MASKPESPYPAQPTSEDELSDTSPKQLNRGANAGAGEHFKAASFRKDIHQEGAGDLDMDPRQPYPTGNPPDPREEFFMINGYYPGEGGATGQGGKPNG